MKKFTGCLAEQQKSTVTTAQHLTKELDTLSNQIKSTLATINDIYKKTTGDEGQFFNNILADCADKLYDAQQHSTVLQAAAR